MTAAIYVLALGAAGVALGAGAALITFALSGSPKGKRGVVVRFQDWNAR